MNNIDEAYRKSKDSNLISLSKALASEAENKATSEKLAESVRREKEGKEREKELLAAAQCKRAEFMEQMREIQQDMLKLKRMGQPVVMEQPKATANTQSEVQNDEMMNTPTAHSPAAVAIPPSGMTHSVRFKLDDGTSAEKLATGSSAPVEK